MCIVLKLIEGKLVINLVFQFARGQEIEISHEHRGIGEVPIHNGSDFYLSSAVLK